MSAAASVNRAADQHHHSAAAKVAGARRAAKHRSRGADIRSSGRGPDFNLRLRALRVTTARRASSIRFAVSRQVFPPAVAGPIPSFPAEVIDASRRHQSAALH